VTFCRQPVSLADQRKDNKDGELTLGRDDSHSFVSVMREPGFGLLRCTKHYRKRPKAAAFISPARERWVKWGGDRVPSGTTLALTRSLNACWSLSA